MAVILPKTPEPLTKREVARRQLVEATRMFFDRRDPIATYTVTCAGWQIISDLLVAERGHGFLRSGHILVESRREEALRAFRAPENFFKHANRDPGDTLSFNAEQVELCLLGAWYEHLLLTQNSSWEGTVFNAWTFTKYPEFFLEGQVKMDLAKLVSTLSLSSSEYAPFCLLLDNPPRSGIQSA